MLDSIDAFIADLAGRRSSSIVNNMYYGNSPEAEIRRDNLHLYLSAMQETRTLLVGEAPGHLGCALTGIPFTSEDVVMRGVANHDLFNAGHGYRLVTHSAPTTENTADVVWGTMKRIKELPLMWNAFPWHPRQDGDIRSNRTPTAAELREGASFLVRLIRLFGGLTTVIAVGRKAESIVIKHVMPEKSSITFHEVRHPARGGERQFVDGVLKLLA